MEQNLCKAFSTIKAKNIRTLEHHSNKNFYQYGIENIGENLQQELLEIKASTYNVTPNKIYY